MRRERRIPATQITTKVQGRSTWGLVLAALLGTAALVHSETVVIAARELCPDPDVGGATIACTPPLTYTEALLGRLFESGHLVFDAGFSLPAEAWQESEFATLRGVAAKAGAGILVVLESRTSRNEIGKAVSSACFAVFDARRGLLGIGRGDSGLSAVSPRAEIQTAAALANRVEMLLAGRPDDAQSGDITTCWPESVQRNAAAPAGR